MFKRTVDILEEQTREYWKLSNTVLGRLKTSITVEKAIAKINDLEFNLGPQRPLLRKTRSLGEVIVQGKSNKKKTSATITLLAVNGNA